MDKQFNMFELMYDRYKISKPIRLIELFGGIGSQAKALENLKADFTHYKLVEFDKYPVASYNAIHGTNFETMDITKISANDLEIVDRDKYEYIMTYSFPCQDISGAGLGKGFKKGSGTRSGLLWEVERLLNECGNNLPQVLLMENVPLVISEKNKPDFDLWVRFLESKGYSNYYQLLNAKDYGIPQNRNRCFMVSILGEYYYEFPKAIELKLKLKDMLENEVDEKYYLSDKMIKYCLGVNQKASDFPRGERFMQTLDMTNNKGVAATITTNPGNRAVDNFIVDNYNNKALNETLGKNNVSDVSFIDAYNRRVNDDISGTITTRVNDSNNTFIAVKNATKQGYLLAKEGDGIDISSRMESHRGTVQTDMAQTLLGGVNVGVVVKQNIPNDYMGTYQYYLSDLRIRKLTPLETWRLMGFDDEDYDKASKVNSAAQLYKQAGNSIVVNVLMAIFKEMIYNYVRT